MSSRRLLLAPIKKVGVTLLLILTLFFASRLMVRALPGNPIETILAETGTSLSVEEVQKEFGLHLSWQESLQEDLSKLILKGDWGRSIHTREPVSTLIQSRLQNSLLLGFLAFLLALSFSLILAAGSVMGSRFLDRLCTLHSALLSALPTPWIGPVLAYFLAVQIPLFEINGSIGLPLLMLSLNASAFWSRLLRQRLREDIRSDVVRYARAKGLSEAKVVIKHGLAPSLGFFFSYFGTQLGQILAGSMIIEVLFDWPGLGSLLIESVHKRDYPVVEGCIFVTASLLILCTQLGDLLAHLWEPRKENS